VIPIAGDRWQQAKALFEAAVEQPAAERGAFVTEAAGDDEALRREVESLLCADADDTGRLDHLPVAADTVLVDHLGGLTAAFRVGPYAIVAPLGAGGMGEVYRARDTALNRDVALKVLPVQFALDPERLARFRHEAQTLASMNHPNIAAIYGLEESSGLQAIALELVEGHTLAERISGAAGAAGAGITVDQALDIARQIAAALEAAHEKGITHCDLKPANIAVTPTGVVKLLDFGIAKVLTDEAGAAGATIEGAIAGTPGYMSPEQARGTDVDRRTDIWAFGCLLYELLAGTRAFQAETLADTMRAVLDEEPAWDAMPAATPRRIRALLRQCLRKDATLRLQHIADARRTIESEQRRRSSRPVAVVAIAAVAVVSIGTVMWWPAPSRMPQRSEWVRLTNLPDSVIHPAVSPDGTMVAFIRGPSTVVVPFSQGQVYVKSLPGGEPVQLTHDKVVKMSPAFSPDGAQVAYTTVDGAFGWSTWIVSVRGGAPQRWLRNASGLVWTGPGQLLFSAMKKAPHMGVVAAGIGGLDPRDVYVPAHAQGMAHRSYPSPDGRWVLLVEMDENHAWLPCRLVPMVGVDRGRPLDAARGRQIGPPGAGCTFAAWSRDGRWMYVTSNTAGANHIWRQRFPDGQPEQITMGPTEEEGIAMAPDGRSFVTTVAVQSAAVWVNDANGERQISLEGHAVDAMFTPAGTHVIYKIAGSLGEYPLSGELRIHDLLSGRSRVLVSGLSVLDYDVSSNGSTIVVEAADRDGISRLWLANVDGHSAQRQIPDVQGRQPRFGADGEILFRRSEGAATFVYGVRADGTRMRKVIAQPVPILGDVSRDGRWLTGWTSRPGNPAAAWQAFPLDGGPPVLLGSSTRLDWSPASDSVSISGSPIADGRTYVVPLDRGEAMPTALMQAGWTERDIAGLPGARRIDATAVTGLSADVYAFSRKTTQRNLYRIPIP
jgi:serine/threonine protein kinase/Tol biopolymer transport system component